MADRPDSRGRTDSRGPTISGRLRLDALLWAWLLRVALWVLPFRRTLALARWGARRKRPGRSGPGPSPAAVRGAVESMDRFVPRFTCLVQAMTAGVLLGRAGAETEIVLGVPQERGQAFEAHAWLYQGGEVVVGGDASLHAEVARLPLRKE